MQADEDRVVADEWGEPAPLERLRRHLAAWLGAWPPERKVQVVESKKRATPGWDGSVHRFYALVGDEGVVISVPPGKGDLLGDLSGVTPQELPDLLAASEGAIRERLGMRSGGRLGSVSFRWSENPAPIPPRGEWLTRDDPRVPPWLAPFHGDVLVAFDSEGSYIGGVGRKRHAPWGLELAVVTDPAFEGRGVARALVAQAARRVLREGDVPTYLHAHDNVASAKVAEAAGFPDRGWLLYSLWGARR